MKKFLFAIFALGLLSPCAPMSANGNGGRTDKPRKVTVKSDTSKGYIEVTVYAPKKK